MSLSCEGGLTACAINGNELGYVYRRISDSVNLRKYKTKTQRHAPSSNALMSEDFPVPVAIHIHASDKSVHIHNTYIGLQEV